MVSTMVMGPEGRRSLPGSDSPQSVPLVDLINVAQNSPEGFGRSGWEASLTLAVLWLAEALLLIRETVADAVAGFNALALPSLVAPNNVST